MAIKRECIKVLSGPMEGTEVDIVGTITIGRSHENALQLNDLQVSRSHAIIQQTPNGTILRDNRSGNGTYVSDRRIIEYRLKDGDSIRIGPVELLYETSSPPSVDSQPSAAGTGVQFQQDEEEGLEASDAKNVYQTFVNATQQAATTDQLREAQGRLAAIYEASQIMSSERDLSRLFERVMDQLFKLVKAHNGVILLFDDREGKLRTEYVKNAQEGKQVKVSSSIVKRAFDRREALLTSNAADDSRFGAGQSIIMQNITSAMAAPLTHQEENLGVLYVDTRGTTNAFSHSDLELLVAFANGAAPAIRNAKYVNELQQAYQDTLIALANAIELRDHYTVGHTWRVTSFAMETAKTLDWPEDKLKECEMGGLLHDVGKIAIDDAILRKPGGLTEEEFMKMKVHPERGARMMRDIERLVPLIPYALYHHERYDGRGYPFGLSGKDIPIEGRLLAVADTFDAMTSNRPYRKGLDPEIAVAEITKGRGSQFDPEIADAFIKTYREGRIHQILQEYHKKDEKSVACPFCSTYTHPPDTAEPGFEFSCNVCHRRLQLQVQNDAYFAELLPITESLPHPTSPQSTKTTEHGTSD